VHTRISRRLQGGKKSERVNAKEIEVPNIKQIRQTYEKMNIFMVKKSGYGIEYLQNITAYEYLELFETLKEIEK
jgi:hypothetical protein